MKRSVVAKTVAAALTGAVLLTGCGVNPNEVFATLDGENITLGVPNFMAQTRAALVEATMLQYYGENMWAQDASGTGVTLEDQFKENLLDEIQELYIMNKHAADYGVTLSDEDMAAINSAAAAFVDQNSGSALSKLGASESLIVDYFKLAKTQSLVKAAIEAGADTNVSDEIANQKTFSYINIPYDYTPTTKEGGSDEESEVELTDEEKKEAAADTAMGLALMASTSTLEELVEGDENLEVSVGHYGAADLNSEEDNSTGFELSVLKAVEALSEGQVAEEPVATESAGYYIVRLDSAYDEAATAEKRESVINSRKSELYSSTYDSFKSGCEWKVNEDSWAKVKFDNLYNVVTAKTDEQAQG